MERFIILFILIIGVISISCDEKNIPEYLNEKGVLINEFPNDQEVCDKEYLIIFLKKLKYFIKKDERDEVAKLFRASFFSYYKNWDHRSGRHGKDRVDIRSKKEFLEHYDNIITEIFINDIINSKEIDVSVYRDWILIINFNNVSISLSYWEESENNAYLCISDVRIRGKIE